MKQVYIIDTVSDVTAPLGALVILWSDCDAGQAKNTLSLPDYIEENASQIRSEYLMWVYELGHLKVSEKSITEHLKIDDDLSYWWATLVSEKANYSKSLAINDAIRMIALEKLLRQHSVEELFMFSRNAVLTKALRHWCGQRGYRFNLMDNLTRFLEAGLYLKPYLLCIRSLLRSFWWICKYLLYRAYLFGTGVMDWKNSSAKITFVSYLFNFGVSHTSENRFVSHYWGDLEDHVFTDDVETRWLHIPVNFQDRSDGSLPFIDRLRELNEKRQGRQVHAALDSFFTFRILGRAFVSWLVIMLKGTLVQPHLAKHTSAGLALWPFVSDDWIESIWGPSCLDALLKRGLFNAAFSCIEKQQTGLYVLENQTWEPVFNSVWRKHRHGKLIGVPHITSQFWNLRALHDPKVFKRETQLPLPLPDLFAINGKAAETVYLEAGYPKNYLYQVEALRYQYLDGTLSPPADSKCLKKKLIVLGDYLADVFDTQLLLLNEMIAELPDWIITIKPHPACKVNLHQYANLADTSIVSPQARLQDLLLDHSHAFTGPSTSAAVDAYLLGLKVITLRDGRRLNLSPLRGFNGLSYISSAQDLKQVLKQKPETYALDSYFNLDRNLTRWKELLRFRNTGG